MHNQEEAADAVPQEAVETEQLDLSNVFPLHNPQRRPRHEPPASEAELAEYRRIRPLLLQMLAEWQTLRSSTGCPVMGQILGPQ